MKLSKRARYALRMMLVLARKPRDKDRISLAEISRITGISRRYMEQLAISLKNASLIEGATGKSGGYRLLRSADKIPIGEIVEASIGPIRIVECLDHPDGCIRSTDCECRLLYEAINQRIVGILNEYTLADLAGKDWKSKISPLLQPDK